MSSEKNIFFHVGLGKTATTFLQYHAFPQIENAQYIQRTRFKKSINIIKNSNAKNILVSREFDQQLEREVKWFSQYYPNTTPIIVFRKHGSWMASQYRRFVKNGFPKNFKGLIDIENGNGYFTIADLDYMAKIEILKKYFTKEPIVLMYTQIASDLEGFLNSIAQPMNAKFNMANINTSRKHTSYNEQQLKGVQAMGKVINIEKKNVFGVKVLDKLRTLFINIIRYSTLYVSKILPKSWFRNEPLINKDELQAIDNFCANDWKKLVELSNQTK